MTEVVIEQCSLEQVDADILAGLEVLYAQAYHDSHMYTDLLEDMTL